MRIVSRDCPIGRDERRGQKQKRNRKTVRNKNICALRRLGISYRNIAWRYDLSIIRVRQIIEAEENR